MEFDGLSHGTTDSAWSLTAMLADEIHVTSNHLARRNQPVMHGPQRMHKPSRLILPVVAVHPWESFGTEQAHHLAIPSLDEYPAIMSHNSVLEGINISYFQSPTSSDHMPIVTTSTSALYFGNIRSWSGGFEISIHGPVLTSLADSLTVIEERFSNNSQMIRTCCRCDDATILLPRYLMEGWGQPWFCTHGGLVIWAAYRWIIGAMLRKFIHRKHMGTGLVGTLNHVGALPDLCALIRGPITSDSCVTEQYLRAPGNGSPHCPEHRWHTHGAGQQKPSVVAVLAGGVCML